MTTHSGRMRKADADPRNFREKRNSVLMNGDASKRIFKEKCSSNGKEICKKIEMGSEWNSIAVNEIVNTLVF